GPRWLGLSPRRRFSRWGRTLSCATHCRRICQKVKLEFRRKISKARQHQSPERNCSERISESALQRYRSERDASVGALSQEATGLVADAIQDVTRRGDLVLDLYPGSGTTLMAAERTGWRFAHDRHHP